MVIAVVAKFIVGGEVPRARHRIQRYRPAHVVEASTLLTMQCSSSFVRSSCEVESLPLVGKSELLVHTYYVLHACTTCTHTCKSPVFVLPSRVPGASSLHSHSRFTVQQRLGSLWHAVTATTPPATYPMDGGCGGQGQPPCAVHPRLFSRSLSHCLRSKNISRQSKYGTPQRIALYIIVPGRADINRL